MACRTIQWLLEQDRIGAVILPTGETRCEVYGLSHHHHFQRTRCCRVFCLDFCPFTGSGMPSSPRFPRGVPRHQHLRQAPGVLRAKKPPITLVQATSASAAPTVRTNRGMIEAKEIQPPEMATEPPWSRSAGLRRTINGPQRGNVAQASSLCGWSCVKTPKAPHLRRQFAEHVLDESVASRFRRFAVRQLERTLGDELGVLKPDDVAIFALSG